jgi:acyl carrier protein
MEPLIELLKRELGVDCGIEPDLCLLSSGLIDSLRFESLLAALGSHYGVKIDSSEVGADNFDSPRQIHAFISAKCSTSKQASAKP